MALEAFHPWPGLRNPRTTLDASHLDPLRSLSTRGQSVHVTTVPPTMGGADGSPQVFDVISWETQYVQKRNRPAHRARSDAGSGFAGAFVGVAGHAQQADMSFFVTSTGSGKGADFGGLEGADRDIAVVARLGRRRQQPHLARVPERQRVGRRGSRQRPRSDRQRSLGERQGRDLLAPIARLRRRGIAGYGWSGPAVLLRRQLGWRAQDRRKEAADWTSAGVLRFLTLEGNRRGQG